MGPRRLWRKRPGGELPMEYGAGLTRTVHVDMTAHPANVVPSRGGHSIGWDGDTLVGPTLMRQAAAP